jgi:hypothetical protein
MYRMFQKFSGQVGYEKKQTKNKNVRLNLNNSGVITIIVLNEVS